MVIDIPEHKVIAVIAVKCNKLSGLHEAVVVFDDGDREVTRAVVLACVGDRITKCL